MADYSEAIDAVSSHFNQAASNLEPDQSPDDAARALELSKATGVPPETIAPRVQDFEAEHKRWLSQQIINNNPVISHFINSNPIHGQLINDDLGNLHTLTQGVSDLNWASAPVAGAKGFARLLRALALLARSLRN